MSNETDSIQQGSDRHKHLPAPLLENQWPGELRRHRENYRGCLLKRTLFRTYSQNISGRSQQQGLLFEGYFEQAEQDLGVNQKRKEEHLWQHQDCLSRPDSQQTPAENQPRWL